MSVNYFDNASTVTVDSRVLEVMLPYFNEIYGNASNNHEFGKIAKRASRNDTFLICVMFVNSKTGVIQPIKEISSIAYENKITFFVMQLKQ